MPVKKICSHTGCHHYREEGHRYCSKHLNEEKDVNAFSFMRHHDWKNFYATTEWRKLSREVLKENPICQCCGVEQSTEVHHVIPHRGDVGLFYDKDNLVALCHNCHSKITVKEMSERQHGSKEEREMRKRYGV